MKMKKLVSAIAALAMSVSSFTAFAAAGDVTTNVTADFNDGTFGGAVMGQQWTPNSSVSDGWFVVGNSAGLTWNVADEELAGPTDVVTVKFKVAYGKLSSKDFWYSISDSKGTAIVDWNVRPYNSLINKNVLGNGTDLPTADDIYWNNNEPLKERAVDTTITIDFAKGTVTQYTKCYKEGTGKAATEATHTNPLPTGVTDVKSLKIGSGYNNASRMCLVDDISITTTEGAAAAMAKYTVNYVLDDKVVKSVDGEGVVGNAPLFEMNEFWSEDATTKYFCVSDDLGDKTIAADGSLVVNVALRAAETYNVTVDAVGGVEQNLVTGTAVEGDAYSYSYPAYIEADGAFYKAEGTTYGETVASANGAIDKDVTYTLADGVVAVIEAEDYVRNASVAEYSNGAYGYMGATNNVGGQTAVVTLPAGVYKVDVAYHNDGAGHGNRGFYLRNKAIEDNEANVVSVVEIDRYAGSGIYSAEMTLTEETTLTLTGYTNGTKTNQSVFFDYAVITKTGDITTDEYVFEGIVIEDFAETALCFEVETADGTDVKSTLLSSFVGTEVSGEGEVNLGIVIVNDVAGATVNKVWLDVDDDKAYTE